jgi:hypothetical protein
LVAPIKSAAAIDPAHPAKIAVIGPGKKRVQYISLNNFSRQTTFESETLRA